MNKEYRQHFSLPLLLIRLYFIKAIYHKIRCASFLNGLVAQYRADLEKAIGATIVSAGIDMCKFTICDKGCRTVNYANNVCLLQLTLKLTFCRFPNWLFPGRVKVKLRLSR